jgi:molecular chaperone GrpE
MREKEIVTGHTSSDQDSSVATTRAGREPPIGELAVELAATKDRLLRSLAEQENVRNQARRDRDEAVRYAAAGFATDLLSTVDNLERAIASVPQDKRSDTVVDALLIGVEATRRALLDAFAKHGLQRIEPLGAPFDPHRHQASFEVADARYPPGAVASVVQPGYIHHDRLLRPALVGVARASDGPSKPASTSLGAAPPARTGGA